MTSWKNNIIIKSPTERKTLTHSRNLMIHTWLADSRQGQQWLEKQNRQKQHEQDSQTWVRSLDLILRGKGSPLRVLSRGMM